MRKQWEVGLVAIVIAMLMMCAWFTVGPPGEVEQQVVTMGVADAVLAVDMTSINSKIVSNPPPAIDNAIYTLMFAVENGSATATRSAYMYSMHVERASGGALNFTDEVRSTTRTTIHAGSEYAEEPQRYRVLRC